MQDVSQISEFGKILIFLIVGFFAVGGTFMLNSLIAPRNPTAEKLTSYECGEEPVGSAWLPFNTRFYVIALIFLLFDVEMVFIFPWSTVFGSHEILAAAPKWGWFALAEMFIFLIILILGLVYVWVKGDLDWIKPKQVIPTTNTVVPNALYEQLNLQQSVYSARPFNLDTASENQGNTTAQPSSEPAAVKRPMFKPTFKKPGNDT
ncbi:NADH-quinone oxidoreductase subunit A [Mucilaginibacter limnophilus]|uniref:NADH-quinone oxidoreductase subunit A n=1 Tax=Mucilaginibacter limnophilus TaxID=1932778 RepID=A0A437MTF2_9SPHI|nr:NADH-quinone oxidoreductase subunit A [Mucilaginibacter limnophilus]RVU00937.1 NADH-quinone oxidoreductase subunit A [Mucilaginibacter limnophilus]